MISTKQILDGISAYAGSRLIPSASAGKATIICGTIKLLQRQPERLEQYIIKRYPFVKDLGLYDNGCWDIETMYDSFAPEVKGQITVNIPLLNEVAFDREEIDILKRYILGG